MPSDETYFYLCTKFSFVDKLYLTYGLFINYGQQSLTIPFFVHQQSLPGFSSLVTLVIIFPPYSEQHIINYSL